MRNFKISAACNRSVFATCLFWMLAGLCPSAFAQARQVGEPARTSPSAPNASSSLPEAPSAESSAATPLREPHSSYVASTRFQPNTPFSLQDRFALEMHTTFGAAAFLTPAYEAAITMAAPPRNYPHDWSDGAGALGRNYGAELARHSTAGLTHFATAAMLREDPRYYPSTSTNGFHRAAHALAFTVIDRSSSGHYTLAVSNLAGSTAGGFIGTAYQPDGFNDSVHAWQRSARELGNFAAHNLTAEFAPALARLAHKFHVPDRIADSFLPADSKQP